MAGAGFILTMALGVATWRAVYPEVEVVTVSRDVPAGTQLTAEMLERQTVVAAARPENALTWDQAVGKWAAIPLLAGEPLTWRRVWSEPPRPKEVREAGGMLTIPVHSTYALHLQPDDRIVIAIGGPAPDPKTAGVPELPDLIPPGTVLLREIRIIDILNSAGSSTRSQQATAHNPLAPPGGGGPLPSALVLEVTESQALVLIGALESNTTLYFYRPPGGGKE